MNINMAQVSTQHAAVPSRKQGIIHSKTSPEGKQQPILLVQSGDGGPSGGDTMPWRSRSSDDLRD